VGGQDAEFAFAGTMLEALMGLTYQPPLAGLGSRFLAVLIDGLIGGLFMLPGTAIINFAVLSNPNNPSVPLLIFGGLLTLVLWMALIALLFAMWAKGKSPGKHLMGLRVIKMDTGRPASFWRMALREIIGKWVSAAICYLGFIWMFLDANKQGWHDKIAGTIVVKEG
jgi:uncharacterized RDD family membrane protein YckC